MHINIQGRHFSITPALNKHVKEKLKKIKYYFDHIIHVHVVLSTENRLKCVAEATITVERHHFHNKISSEDMYKSIDFLFDKIEVQVRRYKEYLLDKKRRKNFVQGAEEELRSSQNALKKDKPIKIDLKELPFSVKRKDTFEAGLQLKALKDVHIAGFFSSDVDEHMSYLIEHKEANDFSLLRYDSTWERHELKLTDKKMEVVSIENIRPSVELIEDAVEYLLQQEKEDYRFFVSARTHEIALLYHWRKNHFELIREKHVNVE